MSQSAIFETGDSRINLKSSNAVVCAFLDALQEPPAIMKIVEEDVDINSGLKMTV